VLVCWWVVQLTAGDASERCKMAMSATLGVIRVRVLSTSTIQVHRVYEWHQSIVI
jgi:hypothetical protein